MDHIKVVLDKRIPINLIQDVNGQNVIFCKSFRDELFETGNFSTKDKDFVHKYVTENNKKYIITDVTTPDGQTYKNVKFQVILNEKGETPVSTFNPKGETSVADSFKLPEKKQLIVETSKAQVKSAKPLDVSESINKIKQDQEYIRKAKQLEQSLIEEKARLVKERKELEEQKQIVKNERIIEEKINDYKQSLLQEFLNVSEKQENTIKEKLSINLKNFENELDEQKQIHGKDIKIVLEDFNRKNLEKLQKILDTNLKTKQDIIDEKIQDYNDSIQSVFVEQTNEIKKDFNTKIKNIENDSIEKLKIFIEERIDERKTELIELLENKGEDFVSKIVDKSDELKKLFDEKFVLDLQQYKEKLIQEINSTNENIVNEYLEKKKTDVGDEIIKFISKERSSLQKDFNKNVQDLKELLEKTVSELNERTPSLDEKIKLVQEKLDQLPKDGQLLMEAKNDILSLSKKYTDSQVKRVAEDTMGYAKRILDLGGGGGSVATQYANGGTMNGNLNVNGNILSGGVNLLNVFSGGGGGGLTDRLVNGSYQTVLSSDGNLIFPTGSKISRGYPGLPQDDSSWFVAPTGQLGGLVSADGEQYIQLGDNSPIYIGTGWPDSAHEWIFGTDGTTLFPNQAIDGGTAPIELKSRSWSQLTYNNNDMTPAPNKNHSTTFFVEGGDALLEIFRWDNSSVLQHRQWTFSSDGSLTFPDNTTQTTAFTGNPDSSNWDSNYTTTNTNSARWSLAYTNLIYNSAAYLSGFNSTAITQNSASWNTAYTNLVYNSTAYLSAYDMSLVNANSANWNNTYTQYSSNSGSYATIGFVNGKFLPVSGGSITGNLVVQGSLTALGNATFANTIFTTTSALSVINTGPGPALYVFQSAGTSDVASFYDGDGVEVLHVGNANPGGNGFVGINESFPAVELSVRGAISASKTITALGGNSNQWNTAYTNLVYNSTAYLSGFNSTAITQNSASWNNAYTNLVYNSTAYLSAYDMSLINSNSANWNTAYTNLVNNSTAYLSAYNMSLVNANSGSWNTAYTNLVYNSTAYLSAYDMSLVNSNSANWNTAYTNLVYNSTAYLSAYDMSLVNSNSANWNTAYTNLIYNSTAYLSGFNSTAITQNSANWNVAYTNLVNNSTAYLSAYDMSLVNSNSASWNTAYTNLVNNSANYLSGASTSYVNTNFVKLSGDNMTGLLTNSVGISSFSLSAKYIDLVHTPANDGNNPVLRIGEYDTASGNVGFSGMYISYNENSNVFGISAQFAPSAGVPAVSIDRNGNVGIGTDAPNAKLTVAGSISASATGFFNNIATQNQVQYLSSGVVKVYQYYNATTNSLDTVFT